MKDEKDFVIFGPNNRPLQNSKDSPIDLAPIVAQLKELDEARKMNLREKIEQALDFGGFAFAEEAATIAQLIEAELLALRTCNMSGANAERFIVSSMISLLAKYKAEVLKIK